MGKKKLKKIKLEDIQKAKKLIEPYILKTPMEYTRSGSDEVGTELFLKMENTQRTGSFKIRGATNKILNLTPTERQKGLLACSAGNHAQGVALAASVLGHKAWVVAPETMPIIKRRATEGYGGEVILHGQSFDQSLEFAVNLQKEKGYTMIHPYLDEDIIAGQGTVGLEILEALPKVNSVVVPIGGGGLISGVATAIKSLNPKCRVYGVVPQHYPYMKNLWRGEALKTKLPSITLADGTAVKKPSSEICQTYLKNFVDDIAIISDEQITESILFLAERVKAVVEGSAAMALAGAKHGGWDLGQKCCVLLSGGNIDLNWLSRILAKGLALQGRLTQLAFQSEDRPGLLAQVAQVVAEGGGNILEVQHDRLSGSVGVKETQINILLETQSKNHLNEIFKTLKALGIKLLK